MAVCNGSRLNRVHVKVEPFRYLACVDCGTDLTESTDIWADRVGREVEPHEIVAV